GLATFVSRAAVCVRGTGEILHATLIIGAVGVEKRRDGQHETGITGTDPGKCSERVVLAVGVVEKLPLRGRVVWIERDLIEVAARLSDDAQLVVSIGVVNQRSETTEAICGVMNHDSDRRSQPERATDSPDARAR